MKKPYRSRDASRRQEIADVVADIDRIAQATGWTPRVSFREGVRRLVEAEARP